LHEIRKYFEERRRKKEEDFIINREKEESIGFHMQDSREATKLDILTESSPSANLIKVRTCFLFI